MILIESRGQMGNQLFQYAFAYATAKKLNTFFVIDKGDLSDKLHYFTLLSKVKMGRLSYYLYQWKLNLPASLYKILLKLLRWRYDVKLLSFEDDCWQVPHIHLSKIENNSIYKGFFQSPIYFTPYEQDIKELFQIKAQYRAQFQQQFGDFFREKEVLVIHIRQKDYLNGGNEALGGTNIALPIIYYQKALELISNIEQYKVIVIGDDLAFIKELFVDFQNFTITQSSEIVDFQIIQNASVAIISNSSFAWWAAYLNQQPHKQIFVPEHWVGYRIKKEFPNSIIPLEWTKIAF